MDRNRNRDRRRSDHFILVCTANSIRIRCGSRSRDLGTLRMARSSAGRTPPQFEHGSQCIDRGATALHSLDERTLVLDLFEYILIMTSVIFAMAVAQILTGLSRLAQSTSRIRPYLAHSVWTLNLFVMIFANWWANGEFRAVSWTLPMYIYMLVSPTLMFFICSLLFPDNLERGQVDLSDHFLRIRPPF
jgi:hypothetical protein